MEIVLITAGNGFLGQHLVKHLQLYGPETIKEIRVLDRKEFDKQLEYEARFPVLSFVGSLFDQDTLRQSLENADSVVHLDEVKDLSLIPDSERMKKINTDGTAELVRQCEASGKVKRFVLLSSFDIMVPNYTHKVYNMEVAEVPIDNWMLQDYSSGKYNAEMIVFGSDKFQSFAIRASPMYGELDDPKTSMIVKALRMARFCNGILPVVSASRDGVIQHTYVGNVAFGIVKVLEKMIADESATKEAVFILDETPFKDFYALIEPYLRARKYRLAGRLVWFSPLFVPYWFFEKTARIVQHCLDLKPYVNGCPSAATVYNYLHNWTLFSGLKALTYVGYKPMYTYEQAVDASTKYYGSVSL